MLYNLKDWCSKTFYTIKYFIYNLQNSITNMFVWFPIIWKDRTYDFTYIYKVLRRKLELQALGLGSRNKHVSTANEVKWIYTCIRLLDKISEDHYENEVLDYYKSTAFFEFEVFGNVEYDNLDLYFAKYPKVFKKITTTHEHLMINFQENRKLIAILIAGENHRRAKNLLYKILNEHLESWWD